MKVVPLTKGKTALVDNEDFESVSKFKWCAMNAGAQTRIGKTRVLMHRLLMQPPPNMQIDHINHDRLDNRRSNLRVATSIQNSRNKKGWGRGLKGVYDVRHEPKYKPPQARIFKKGCRFFRAQIVCNGKSFYLGRFYTEYEAGKAYDAKALELFGEFAYLNFPNKNIFS